MHASRKLKSYARKLGFDLVGIAPCQESSSDPHFLRWIAEGKQSELWYLSEHRRLRVRSNPSLLLQNAKSIVVCAMSHRPPSDEHASDAKFARYAWGEDYHDVLMQKLKELSAWISETYGGKNKAFVDTAPILERDAAARAGIGWVGKNTCLIDQQQGSFLYLGEILSDIAFMPDAPIQNHCGTCTACLDACPTDAFDAPYTLNAQKCISYHNLESKSESIPTEIAQNSEGWVAGCDICQDVCPWNQKAPAHQHPEFEAKGHVKLTLQECVKIEEDDFKKLFAGTALARLGAKRLRRNAKALLEDDVEY